MLGCPIKVGDVPWEENRRHLSTLELNTTQRTSTSELEDELVQALCIW